MIEYQKFQLGNGLRFIVHQDRSTPLAVVNLLYNVGARDESPERTGFAHLFEHLMFSGSENVPDFDSYIQNASGDCNAFTNNDITNYYDILPAENVETALWLEADRMARLRINERSLSVQRKVVVEEFYETCLNIPYGDAWHRISNLAYQQHPYRWPTIGLMPQHIQEAQLEDVTHFYKKHYAPNNAILVVAGNVDVVEVQAWVEKYFGGIPAAVAPHRNWPIEQPQVAARHETVQADVPFDALYLVFHTMDRLHPDYYAMDLLSDILCSGKSSRLYRRVKKKLQLFADIDSYITGSFDPGLLLIEGRLAEGIPPKKGEEAVWEVLRDIQAGKVTGEELQKYKNKAVSAWVFDECHLMNRAMNLAFFESLGQLQHINEEPDYYKKVTLEDIQRVANEYLSPEKASLVVYERKVE